MTATASVGPAIVDEEKREMKPLRDWRWAAEMLGVSRTTLYELAAADLIPCVKLGARSVRFDEEALQEWAMNGGARRVPGTPKATPRNRSGRGAGAHPEAPPSPSPIRLCLAVTIGATEEALEQATAAYNRDHFSEIIRDLLEVALPGAVVTVSSASGPDSIFEYDKMRTE